jgi:hypothetical protein
MCAWEVEPKDVLVDKGCGVRQEKSQCHPGQAREAYACGPSYSQAF